jgi:hypothetical protein
MKPVLTFLGLLISLTFSRAQEADILTLPTVVSDVFTLLYPDAKSIEWQFTGGHYKAEFKNYKTPTMALIDVQGRLIQTWTQIKITALPQLALDYLAKSFIDKKINLATISEDDKGVITFTAVADKTDFTFDSEGKLLQMSEVANSGEGIK